MAIPSSQDFMLPLLELLYDGKVYKTSDIREELAKYFNITEDEKKILLPSGKQELYKNRIAWAITHLYHAGLIERLNRGVYKITERGVEVLNEMPLRIDVNYLMRFPEYREFLVTKDKEVPQLPDTQKIVGALAEFGVKKGIFVTTSDFTKEAREYIPKTDTKIVLINGQMLANLMIEYNIGVSVDIKYEIKKIDKDYFDEG